MKNVFKLCLVAIGFTMAIMATSSSASATQPISGGSCQGDNHWCGTTAGGTVLNGYWTEQ